MLHSTVVVKVCPEEMGTTLIEPGFSPNEFLLNIISKSEAMLEELL